MIISICILLLVIFLILFIGHVGEIDQWHNEMLQKDLLMDIDLWGLSYDEYKRIDRLLKWRKDGNIDRAQFDDLRLYRNLSNAEWVVVKDIERLKVFHNPDDLIIYLWNYENTKRINEQISESVES